MYTSVLLVLPGGRSSDCPSLSSARGDRLMRELASRCEARFYLSEMNLFSGGLDI